MTARDLLAAELWKHHYEEFDMNPDGTERSYCACGQRVYPHKSLVQHQAEIAIAALRPTVTSVEGLDALPAASVILDVSQVPWVSDGDSAQPWASLCEDSQGGPIWKDSQDIGLPATVLHCPAVAP